MNMVTGNEVDIIILGDMPVKLKRNGDVISIDEGITTLDTTGAFRLIRALTVLLEDTLDVALYLQNESTK